MKHFYIVAFLFALPVTATAAETVSYTYDAKGRLIKIVRSGSANTGSANNGVTTTYDHDKADNRKAVRTTGAAQ